MSYKNDNTNKKQDSQNQGSNEICSHKPHYPKMTKNSIIPEVHNTPLKPVAIENAFVKVPVVLGETTVHVCLDTEFEFPEPVLEIKEIKKNLKIVQCRLMLPTNKLFIKGFIRKNIQYATPVRSFRHGVQSEIHSYTIDIPFNACTEICYINEPQFCKNPDTRAFTFFSAGELPSGFSQKEKLLSGDFTQYDQVSGEIFNELPFCELLSSCIYEYDEFLDRKMGTVYDRHGNLVESPFEEGTFTKVEEKMVVEISLKVLQNQQVHVDSYRHKRGK